MWLKPKLLLFLLPSAFRLQIVKSFATQQGVYKTGNFSDRSFRLIDHMTDTPTLRNYPILWYDEVSSTMDKARELSGKSQGDFFAVAAKAQTKGRGTRGRDWISAQNNLLLTVSLHRKLVPVPITLLPLRVGTIIASCMARRVTSPGSKVTLKWPNDILINSRKACGVLIEMEGDMILIGIGCNVLTAPAVNSATNSIHAAPVIRPATCLAEHNPHLAEAAAKLAIQNAERQQGQREAADATVLLQGETVADAGRPMLLTLEEHDFHKELGVEICDNLYAWAVSRTDTAELVRRDFEANMDVSPQRLRDEPDEALGTVLPVGLNADGTLKVKYAHNGEEGVLMAEYLW